MIPVALCWAINQAGLPTSLPGATEGSSFIQTFIPFETVGDYELFVDDESTQLPSGLSFEFDKSGGPSSSSTLWSA